jgi:hypothetical protein
MKLLSETAPSAQRAHVCAACSFLIQPNERHTKFVYLDNSALRAADRFLCSRVHFFCPCSIPEEMP